MPSLLSLTGFQHPSNLALFLLLPCTFALFNLANLKRLLSTLSWTPSAPGDHFWFREGDLRWLGLQVHIWSVVPAGILLPAQFVPVLRRKWIGLHRWAGRWLLVMLLIGDVTALIMTSRSFGGLLDTQVFTVILALSTTVSVYKAWSSIREGRIDRHREWVLRTWAYACSILTLRVLMIPLGVGITRLCPNRFRFPLACAELAYLYRNKADGLVALATRYPACVDLAKGVGSADLFVTVPAFWNSGTVENRTALVNTIFGPAGILGFFINAFLLEIYLRKTADEDARLRKVSLMKIEAAGRKKEQ